MSINTTNLIVYLSRVNWISDKKKKYGLINPTLINKSALNPKPNQNSAEFKGKSSKEQKQLLADLVKEKRLLAATYLGRCMLKWQDRYAILLPYNFE